MKKRIKKFIRTTFGILLILVGIAGLFMPVLPGIVMMGVGISLVNPVLGKKIMKRIKKFYHRIRTNKT